MCLILTALTVYNSKELDNRALQIVSLEEKQRDALEKIDALTNKLKQTNSAIEEANESWKRLEGRIAKIDSASGQYHQKLEDLKNENEQTKNLLDTRLPDDIKRLLMEATGTSN